MSSSLHRARWRTPAALAACMLLVACGGSEGSGPSPLQLTATFGAVGQPTISDGADGTPPVVRCDLPVTLAATGAGTARLLGGRVEWYSGLSRVNPMHAATIPAEAVARAFAPGTIAAGSSLSGTWPVQDSVAFTARLAFDWQPEGGGPTRQVFTRITCGPALDETAAGPEISGVAIDATGDLEPGDSVTVRFAVTATQGLWRTRVQLGGACAVQGSETTERFEVGPVTRERRLALPASCAIGVPLVAVVTAVDAAQRVTISAPTTGPRLVDREVPSVGIGFGGPYGRAFFVGDTIQVEVRANDNVGLVALVVARADGSAPDTIALPDVRELLGVRVVTLRAGWVGAGGLRFQVVDRGGNSSNVATMGPGILSIFPTAVRPWREATVAGEVQALAVDARGNAVVLQAAQSRLQVLARATLQAATVAFTRVPTTLALTPSGDSAVVLFGPARRLRVVDLRSAQPIAGAEVAITGLDEARGEVPLRMVVTAKGTAFAAVAGTDASAARLVEIDLTTGVARARPDLAAGTWVADGELFRSGDGRTAWATSGDATACRWTIATDTFGGCRPFPAGSSAAPHADARGSVIVTAGSALYDGTLATSRSIQYFLTNQTTLPAHVASPDGAHAYLLREGTLVRVRTSDGATLDLPRPGEGAQVGPGIQQLAISPDGRTAVMAGFAGAPSTRIILVELP